MPDTAPPINYMYMTPAQVRKLLHTIFGTLDQQPPERVIMETFADRRPSEGPFLSIYIREAKPMWDSAPVFRDMLLDKDIYKGETHYTADITFWGKQAFERAQAVAYMLSYEARHSDIWKFIGAGQPEWIKDVSTVKGGHVLQRARFQFKFYVTMASQIQLDWFNRIELELILVRKNSLYTWGFEAHA